MNANAQALVSQYDFNNTLNDVSGNNAFGTGNGLSFGTDRFGVANNALVMGGLTNAGDVIAGNTTATITNLPIGNSARSISIWVKSNMTANNNPIFSYGNSSANAAFGLGKYITRISSGGPKPTISTKTDLLLYGYANDLAWAEPVISSNWNHFVVTYTGSVASIYMNGVLQASGTKTWNTANTVFRLGLDTSGSASFVGIVDDLKIFSRALTQTEITNLYTTNSDPTALVPTISSISENSSGVTSATINYTLNANDYATTSIINYGTSTGSLNMQVSGGSASGSTNTIASGVLLGLNLGTTYYYQIVATNSAGSTTSATRSFTQINPSTAIAEYNFDNSYNNIYGNTPFAGSGLSFDDDRHGNPSNALRILSGNNNSASATIANLPIGNASRTVSVWVLQPTASSDNYVFRYGALTPNNVYGLSNQGTNLINFGYANDLVGVNQAASGANWVHVVTTFDGTTARIYRNGVQVASGNKAGWNTLTGDFILGRNVEVYIDDLKIYNRTLTQEEITNLYTNNAILSNQNFQTNNLKVSIYPNPASNNFTIEMKNELKSVEIYSIQGQKMLASNSKNIDISDLSKGMYLVRIEDSNNAVATQKLIIK